MKKTILALSLISLFALSTASNVSAQYYVPGPSPKAQVFINKLVQNPISGQMTDNLGINDTRFKPNQTVNFQIQVQNTGNLPLSNLVVSDKLPSYVESIQGPGTFDSNTKTLTFSVDSLAVNETKSFNLSAKVMQSEFVPSNQVTCINNVAEVRVDGLFSQDSAQFCLENPVAKGGVKGEILPAVTELPVTGPEHVAIVILGILASLGLGVYFYRKATR